jgi:hypothetical protein
MTIVAGCVGGGDGDLTPAPDATTPADNTDGGPEEGGDATEAATPEADAALPPRVDDG